MRVLSEDMRRAKLAKLVELEGFEDETALFAAAVADSVWLRVIPVPSRRNSRNPVSRPRLLGSVALRPAQVSEKAKQFAFFYPVPGDLLQSG